MKKRILLADTAPLYPPLWGGPKRIWNLYSNFSQDLFDITYVGIKANLEDGLKYSFNKIRDNFKEISCAFPPHYYLWHLIEQKFFKDTSLDLFIYLRMHTDWHFKYALNSQNADVIICSHPWSSLCVEKKNTQFFIYDAHNCEYRLMDRILGKHIFKKFVLKQVKRIEGDACRKSDLILVCSEKEKNDFLDLYGVKENKIIIIPNGALVRERIGKTRGEGKAIIFVGAYYKPNIDAARLIIEELAPRLREFKFLIIGTVFDAFKTEKIPENIKFLGKISEEELNTALMSSDIAINPMFDGSGINIKMLDYMSYGLPIVTTQVGARGIKTNGRQPMIVSTPDNFIDNIKMLSNDTLLYKRMSIDGMGLVAERYDWKKISAKLEGIILEKSGPKSK